MLPAHVDEDDRDVVGRAAVESLLEEVVGSAAGREAELHGLEDVRFVDHAREAVGAEQPPVAWLRVHHEHVELGIGVHVAEHAHEHGTAGVVARLLRRNAARIDQTLHEGVVGGDLRQCVVAVQVDARVADVADHRVFVDHDDRADRGAEAGEFRAVLRGADQVARCGGRGGLQRGLRVFGRRIGLVEGLQTLDRDAGGDVSAGVPAHPVGDDEEIRPGVSGILVVGADLPGVGDRDARALEDHAGVRLAARRSWRPP